MKKNVFLFCWLFFVVTGLFCQNPGNVGTTNLTAWFKPDALALGNVINWTTTFPTGAAAITVTDTGAPYPIATNTPPGNVSNYNTSIHFTNAQIFGTNWEHLEDSSALNLIDNTSAGDEGTCFLAYYSPGNISNGAMMSYNESGTDAVSFQTQWIHITKPVVTPNASRIYFDDNRPKIIAYKGNASSATSMSAYNNTALIPTQASGGTAFGNQGLNFGQHPTGGVSPSVGIYKGYLHEVIFYNRDLSGLEIIKVNTYLAVKYGATHDNTGGGTQGDYVATNGAIIWDASVNPSYHNDVFGIGRDDGQALLQKQSHAFDDTARVYINTLQATNIANTGAFIADASYVMLGDNKGEMYATAASNLEVPAGVNPQDRIAREWKVTKTNFAQNFNCDITPATSFIFNTPNCLKLLVDDDGDFSNGGTTAYFNGDGTGISITIAGAVIQIANLSNTHLPNNTTKYITLASNISTITTPVNSAYCAGDIVPASGFTSLPTGTTYGWFHSNTTVGLTAPAGTGDVPAFTASNTTLFPDTTIVSVYPTLSSCPGDTVDYLIIVNPIPPAPTASSQLICINTSATLTGTAPGGTYNWFNTAIGGSSLFTGASYATPTLLANDTFWVQTTLNNCTSLRTSVIVNLLPAITVDAGLDDTICSGDTAHLVVVVTPNTPNNTYNWSAPGIATIDTFFNQAVTPTATTIYTITVTDAFACVGMDSVTVTVKPLPIVTVPATISYCNGDLVPASAYTSIPLGATYTWINSNPTVGLAPINGTVNTPSFTATNTATQTDSTTITVTPSYDGCTGNPTAYIIMVNPVPTLFPLPDLSYCLGDTVPANPIGGTPIGLAFDWTNTNTAIGLGANGMAQELPSFVATNTTNLPLIGTVTITPQASGCTGSTSSFLITVSAPIFMDRIIKNATCFGDNDGQISVIPSGGTPVYTYSWTNGDTDSTASNLPQGPVTVTVTDVNGCTQDSTFYIAERDSIDYITFSAVPDNGCSPLEVDFTATIDPVLHLVDHYIWNFGNNLLPIDSFNSNSIYITPGSYDVSLTVIDFDGCSGTLTKKDVITVHEDPEAHFTTSPDAPTMFNPTIEFNDASIVNVLVWEWFFDTLGVSLNQHPRFTFPGDSGTYAITLIVEDDNTCKDTLTQIIFIRSEIAFFFPNGFSPNGDGLNDTFGPKGFGMATDNYSFIVFNRWGEVVFKTNNVLEGWDGYYKGKLLPNGVYVWRADFKDLIGNNYRRNGQLNLIR